MENLDLRDVLKNHLSRYSLVTATAKLARKIAEESEGKRIILTEKPVSLAVDEIKKQNYVIVEPEEIRNL